ncbi:hypothetical protein [Granulicella arctica]|uniref:hypothetical protein n=1 Tax=Granulicella arctica TaxID=940613 RepID=UPI0021E0FCB1|nr:hypothetical protein [Granulicella arctica]
MQRPHRVIALTLALLAFSNVTKRVEAKGGAGSAPPSPPAECMVDLGTAVAPAPALQQKLNACGWALLHSLTVGGGAAPPAWETWQTKADVKIDALAPSTSRGETRAAAFAVSPKPADAAHLFSSLREPMQRHGDAMTTNGPQLAQVLYNQVAATYIKKNFKTYVNGKIPSLQLPAGSIIAKAVWAKIDLSAAAPAIYSSNFTSLTETIQSDATSVSNPYLASPHPEWTSLTFDKHPGTPCGLTASVPQAGTSVSDQCLHTYTLDPKTTSQALATLAASHDVLTRGCQKCLVALVGVNMMIRPRDKQDWIWITLWWNGRDNGPEHSTASVLSAPWKYYEMNVTNSVRQQANGSSPNIIFNPSLEGMEMNGRVANCRTCHNYAASSKASRSASMSGCGAGSTLGSAPVPSPVGSQAAQQQALSKRYLDAVLTTDSVWSLAGVPLDPTVPNASLQAAGCQPIPAPASASLVHP